MSRIFKPVADVRKEKSRKRFLTRAKVGVLVAFIVIAFYLLISYSGRWLVRDDSFGHVSWAVVLDGQSGDLERSDFAADLVREGRADSLWCSGGGSSAIGTMRIFMRRSGFYDSLVEASDACKRYGPAHHGRSGYASGCFHLQQACWRTSCLRDGGHAQLALQRGQLDL